ncbi:hypothetical protein ATO46_07000 [Aeromonas schubertii]|uniref:hypothetical protein n=1 Tax=Aeromonas schubertii TaxID=652 RepID=UPI00067F046B|nr:hypothetical protein [Aeromonas schubertii]KUE79042.1 hypothetical protein ATO46_07000 [Aeromonas schubertii]
MADSWDDYCEQERASPDFLVEREHVVGEGALLDQLARLADLYVVRRQGDRMAGLADLGDDLLKIADQETKEGVSPSTDLLRELYRRR